MHNRAIGSFAGENVGVSPAAGGDAGLIQTRSYRGLWWIPSAPDQKLSGTLTITKGDPRLDVVGDFGHDVIGEGHGKRTYSVSLANLERVLGITTDELSVTLVDCTRSAASRTFRA